MVCSVVFACRVVTNIVVTCVYDFVVDLFHVRNQSCSACHVIEFWSGLQLRTKTETMVRLDGKRMCPIVLLTARYEKIE